MRNLINISLLPCVALVIALTLFGGFSVNAQRCLKDTISLNSAGKIVINQSPAIDKLVACDSVLTIEQIEDIEPIEHSGVAVMPGFRIQVFSGSSSSGGKTTARSRAAIIKGKMTDMSTYIIYKAPYWRLRVGDFVTREDALVIMEQLKSLFPEYAKGMTVVRDKINYRK